MSKRPAFFTFEALVLILAIYFGFAGATVILYLLTTGNFPLIAAISGMTVFFGYILYIGYKHRQIAYFSATLSILGIVLIALTAVTYPKQVITDLRADKAFNMTAHLQTTDSNYPNPTDENRWSRTIILPPNSNVTYYCDHDWGEDEVNGTITEFRFVHNDTVDFSILRSLGPDPQTDELRIYHLFNMTLRGPHGSDYPDVIYWTPQYSIQTIGSLFQNPGNNDVAFSFSVTTYYLKNVESLRVTEYQPLAPSSFMQVGLALIAAAIFLEGYTIFRQKPKTA